ncbi:MAG: DHHW family protein, partial [Raineya sp.]|nr:DHHW family protein [Raineya sp.]
MQSKIWFIRISTFLFVGILMIFGILFIILPKQEISEYEKRKLTPLPKFSWQSFWKGSYMDSLDLYVADNFPFREGFVQTNFTLANWRGWKNEEASFYQQKV